ncbi:hypothetical protein niasHT_003370 [Heterodera trifolii]|uniref:BTB domain-containing protein n=1 Tax=Heterodera trifolii TaxID=157864 RepID=A0ABD2LP09_9BILA
MDKLAERMNRLLSTGVDADVHFLVGQGDKQELLPAHKPILRVASDVFDAMFRFDEEFPILATPKPGKKAFIYADDLSGLNGHNAIDVLYAAKKYNLPSLVEACVKISIKELRNVFMAFSKARLLEEKNAADLMGSDEFFQIDQKLLCELLGRNQLVSNEEHLILFYAVLWAIKQCQQKGMECSPKNLRELLGPALYQIRFPIIQKHFLEFFVSLGVLTSDELWKIFAQIETKFGTKYLGFFIQCNADDYGSDLSCTCSATIYIVPQHEANTHYNGGSKTFDQSFCSKKGGNCWGFVDFMTTEKLMNPGAGWYNKAEDTVTLSAHLTTVEL